MDILLSVILSALLVLLTVKKRAFTLPAALTAAFILITSAFCASYAGIFIVIFAYGIIFAVDLAIGKKSDAITGEINKKSGARDVFQVLSNSLAALIALLLGKIFGMEEFTVVYAVALTECLADSLASDVGVLSKKPPVDVLSLRPVERGMSGGVSALGSLSALVGSLSMSAFTVIFFGFVPKYFIAMLLLPMLGVFIDSALGSRVQAKYRCPVCKRQTEKEMHCDTPTEHIGGVKFMSNDAVNLISNLITTIIAILVLIIL